MRRRAGPAATPPAPVDARLILSLATYLFCPGDWVNIPFDISCAWNGRVAYERDRLELSLGPHSPRLHWIPTPQEAELLYIMDVNNDKWSPLLRQQLADGIYREVYGLYSSTIRRYSTAKIKRSREVFEKCFKDSRTWGVKMLLGVGGGAGGRRQAMKTDGISGKQLCASVAVLKSHYPRRCTA